MEAQVKASGSVLLACFAWFLFLWNLVNLPPLLRLTISLLPVPALFGLWRGTSACLSRKTGRDHDKVLKDDAKSYLAFLLLLLFPLKNLIELDPKFAAFDLLPSALLLAYAFALFIAMKVAYLPLPEKNPKEKWIYGFAILAAIIWLTLSLLKHYSFFSTGYDLGIYNQVVAGYSNLSLWYSIMIFPLIGMHVQPILFVIALLYKVVPSPELLLFLQSIALASSVIPLYKLAKLKLRSAWLPLIIALAFLVHPTLTYVALFDFHPEVFAVPLLFWVFLAIQKEQYKLAMWLLIAVTAMKEQFAFFLVTFGVYLVFRKKRLMGSLIAIAGIAWFLLAFFVISPLFYTGPNIFLTTNPYFGSTLGEAMETVFLHPLYSLKFLFSFEKLAYVVLLLTPLGLIIPFLAPEILLLGIFEGGLVFFYSPISIQQIAYHHSILLLTVAWLAVVITFSRIEKWLKEKKAVAIAVFMLALSVLAFLAYGPFTLFYDVKDFNAFSPYAKAGREMVNAIPKDAPVAAPNWVTPHLSNRQYVYTLSNYLRGQNITGNGTAPEYLLLDLGPALQDPKRNGDKLSSEELRLLFNDPAFGIIGTEETWVLLQRSADHEQGLCALQKALNQSALMLSVQGKSCVH